METTSIFQGISSKIKFLEQKDKIITGWNDLPVAKKQIVYNNHYRLAVAMIDRYDIDSDWFWGGVKC